MRYYLQGEWSLPGPSAKEGVMAEKRDFDWKRDVGEIDPCQVQDLARHSGQSLEDFARDFVKRWPFSGEPSEEQIRNIVAEVRRCPRE